MRRHIAVLFAAVMSVFVTGCDRQTVNDGPPAIHLGNSVCDQCNMIISDERFATATIISGPRGPEPRLFDDFNCQINYETEHAEQTVLGRWSHEHDDSQWLATKDAYFLISPRLRTPMASQAAAYISKEAAEQAKEEHGGEIMAFEFAWNRIGKELE